MPQLTRHWTVDDVHALPDDGNRYEVIDGELLVTPAPSWRHQRAIAELMVRLHEYLLREPVGLVYTAPIDVIFSASRLVQPDVLVAPLVNARPPVSFADAGRLLLAVEVVSPSSRRADRVTKRTLYGEEAVPEYWIVDLDERTMERVRPGGARSEVLVDELAWLPEGAATAFHLDVPTYFATVLGD